MLAAVAKHLAHSDVPAAKAVAENRVLAELSKVIEHQALSHALADIQVEARTGSVPESANSGRRATGQDGLKLYLRDIDVAATVARCRKMFDDIISRNYDRCALLL